MWYPVYLGSETCSTGGLIDELRLAFDDELLLDLPPQPVKARKLAAATAAANVHGFTRTSAKYLVREPVTGPSCSQAQAQACGPGPKREGRRPAPLSIRVSWLS